MCLHLFLETTKSIVMKKQKTPWSIKILYWLTSFAFWMMTFFAIVTLVVNLILITDIFTDPIQLRISMPVPIEVVENGILHLEDADLTVRIEKAYGKIHFVDTPIYITRMTARMLILIVLIGWFITWKIKNFVTNLRNGLLFEIENINNLKHISYGLVLLFVLSRVYMEVLKAMLESQLEFSSIKVGGETYNTDIIIEIALLLWVLAHVFVKGVEMKNEQELTI